MFIFNKGKFVLYVSSCLQYKTDRIPVETETFEQSYEIFKKKYIQVEFYDLMKIRKTFTCKETFAKNCQDLHKPQLVWRFRICSKFLATLMMLANRYIS